MSYSYNSHPLAYLSNLVFFTLQIYYYLITFFTRSLNSAIYSIVSSFLVFIVFLTILISFEISYIILYAFAILITLLCLRRFYGILVDLILIFLTRGLEPLINNKINFKFRNLNC